MLAVAWSSTHQEFLISDSYYFSVLARESLRQGIQIVEVDCFEELFTFPVVVFNYCEQPFNRGEITRIQRAVEEGKRVIFTGHFQNKDNVAKICSAVAEHFGLRLRDDEVFDRENCHEGDPYLVVTARVKRYGQGVKRVVFPYSAPVEVKSPAQIILRGEPTAGTGAGEPLPVLAAETVYPSGGSFILCGSCVFWDNYSIMREDNLTFALNLLRGAR